MGEEGKKKNIHSLPTISTKQQMNNVIVHLRLRLEVRIDHLADGRGSVGKPHSLDFLPGFEEAVLQKLDLGRFAAAVETFDDY